MFEAIALAVHFQDVDMMGQAVEKRASEAFGSEGAEAVRIPEHAKDLCQFDRLVFVET